MVEKNKTAKKASKPKTNTNTSNKTEKPKNDHNNDVLELFDRVKKLEYVVRDILTCFSERHTLGLKYSEDLLKKLD